MNKFISLDTELGGIGPEYSLLTAYFVVLDDQLNFVDDLYLYLKPDNGIYQVCGPSMDINKIDLVEHDKKSITYKDGGTILYNFLKKHSDGGKIKLIPVGHGIYMDVVKIYSTIISRGSWESFVSYRKIDTQGVYQFLKQCNFFPGDDCSGSLKSLAKMLGISFDETQLHDAKADTLLTVYVFRQMALKVKLITDASNWMTSR